jgi:hypothetical protein
MYASFCLSTIVPLHLEGSRTADVEITTLLEQVRRGSARLSHKKAGSTNKRSSRG